MSRLNTFLTGIKVLDLSRYIPGPLATLLLSDMGAEVLKVEPPEGDGMQELGPRDQQDRPVYYDAVNAGKSVVRLNLKEPEDRARLLELVEEADVLVEGFRPGVMARLGLDYQRLRQANPRIIYCALSGYGANGPLAQAAGHDGNYLASAGVLYRNDPSVFDPPVADSAGSLFAALTIVGALHGRARDGLGCEIDLGIADTIMPLQLLRVASYGVDATVSQPESDYLNGGAAYYRIYETAEGAGFMLGAIETKFWKNFCTVAGKPEWIDRQSDPMPQTDLKAELEAFFLLHTREECSAKFAGVDCCLSPVLDLGEALQSRQVQERGLIKTHDSGALQALFPVLLDGWVSEPRPPLRQLTPGDAGFEFTSSVSRRG